MTKDKKYMYVGIGLLLVTLVLSGVTYAVLTWTSTKTNIGINTDCFTIDYTKGDNITGKLKLINWGDIYNDENNTFTIKEGMGMSYVNLGIKSACNIEGYGSIYLNVTELSDTFKDGGDSFGALRYAVLKNTSDLEDNNLNITNLKEQSFEMLEENGIVETGKIKIHEETLSNTEVNKYIIIIYIDEDMAGNDVLSATFKESISAEATQKNKNVIPPDYCFNLVKKDEEAKTASIGGECNSYYADYLGTAYNCYEGNDNGYEEISDVVIPSVIDGYTIVGIKGYSFFNRNLTSVVIPDTVTTIGYTSANGSRYGAFGSNKLTSLVIPSSVTWIGFPAFQNNSTLSEITVDPNNTTYDSRNDSNAIIETATNTLIQGCKNTIISDSITAIGDYAFCFSQLTSITIPDSVTTIGNYAFSSNKLTNITIPDSVSEIKDGAFKYNNLNYVYIGSNSKLSVISKHAFSSSNDTYTSFNGITYVDNPNLKTIYYNGSNALTWRYAINGSNSSSKFVTRTVPSYTSGNTVYNEVIITTGTPS